MKITRPYWSCALLLTLPNSVQPRPAQPPPNGSRVPATKPQSDKAQAAAWDARGLAAFKAGDYTAAGAAFRQAVALDTHNLTYLANLSATYLQARQWPQAQALLENRIKTMPPASPQRPALQAALADVHFAWAKSLETTGQYEPALRHYQSAYQIDKLLRPRDTAFDLSGIAAMHAGLNRYDEALAYYQQTLSLVRQLQDKGSEAKTLNNIGGVYINLSRHDAALTYFQQALPLLRQLHDRQTEATTLSNIGAAYTSLSRYAEALNSLQQALPIVRDVKDSEGEARTLNNIGMVYLGLSRPDEALKYLQPALPLMRQSHNRSGEATTLGNISMAYAGLHRDTAASQYYQQALAAARQSGDRQATARTLSNLGTIATRARHYAEALQYYQLSLPLLRAVHNTQDEAGALNNIGMVYANSNRYAEASRSLQQALPLLRQVGDKRVEATTLSNLMEVWQKRNQPLLAILYGKQAVNAYQEVRRNLRGLETKSQQAFLKSNEDTYRILADLLIGAGRLAEAQQVLGMLKEEEFFQFVRRDPAAAPGLKSTADYSTTEGSVVQQDELLSAGVVRLANDLAKLQRLKSRTPEQEQQLVQVNAALTAARDRYERFLQELPQQFSKSAATAMPNLHELQGLQSDLRELAARTHVKAAVIYTLVSEKRLNLIFVGPAGPPVPLSYDIPASQLSDKIFAFRDGIQNERNVEKASRELYDIVFCKGALQQQLAATGITTLMWSLDGTLRYLPLPALRDDQGYLLERYEMEVFTLGSLARLKDEPRANWRLLGLGVTQAHQVQTAQGTDSFDALRGVAGELRGIVNDPQQGYNSGVLPGQLLLDNGFTKDALQGALRPDAGPDGDANATAPFEVVHIASHFRLRPGNNADSYLLLGDGQALTLSELDKMSNVQPLFAGVDLMTLSACETALSGDKANGAEVDSFGALAQQQGAKAVLATLWSVADDSTSLLMREFYRIRATQPAVTKVQTLRAAQLALLHGTIKGVAGDTQRKARIVGADTAGSAADRGAFTPDPNAPFAHPYFWAPFILIGNWR